MDNIKIGVIGGTGLYQIDEFEDKEMIEIETPFGKPSDKFVVGKLFSQEVVFLPRHNRKHNLLPTEVNYKANIWGMKKLGVTHLISVTAVGSMKKELEPGNIVIIDQFIDMTKRRDSSFFGKECVAHVSFAKPLCEEFSEFIFNSAKEVGTIAHLGGTYICIEGPSFSTKAESLLYRSWGVSVIGMTNVTEAKLAKEAELSMATIALVTDYDCWHEDEADVTADSVMETLSKNSQTAKKIVVNTIKKANDLNFCSCHDVLSNSLITKMQDVPEKTKSDLAPILSKYY
ncbi:MAG: S-methyl-5'-thioadenosine phosphorylase [Pseudomonadota bacterium]